MTTATIEAPATPKIHTGAEIKAATKKAGVQMIRENLEASNAWLLRGLVAIYARQTADEQAAEITREHNGVGFTAFDAEILTSFAKQVERFNKTPAADRNYTTPLSYKQTVILRKRMKKYAGQLLKIATGE